MHDLFLVIHFIGLAMAVGTGFANLFLAAAAAKLEPAERGSFMAKTSVLVRMGHTGLGLLILSGLYLMTPYWGVLSEMPTLITKLALVVVQIILITVISILVSKAKKENNLGSLLKLKPFGMIIFFTGITIVILAVLTFH
ncbi:MAG TPA: hypothetical protein VGQ59_13560 [Cyclobacteriaceae bacterium]|jgi:uncharacterized membrane protein|nr:hypothetical protein [Cyclobacteriaceae bacterium]